jgi:hypothetical protein
MGAQFCMGCGQALPAGAQFCPGCGTAVPNPTPDAGPGPAPLQFSPPPPPGTGAPAPGGPSLSAVLGLAGGRSFLLQHQLISAGHSYRVLASDKRHLFTVRENVGQELRSNFLGGMGSPSPGLHLGSIALGSRTFAWTVLDSAGTPRGAIAFQVQGFHAQSTLTDSAGAPVLVVHVDRGMVGGLTATAAYPDGRPMFQTRGNLIRHNFSIHDPGGAEVAKIHEAWASVRDTYNLDLVGNVDPLFPLVFAILIDREKESK